MHMVVMPVVVAVAVRVKHRLVHVFVLVARREDEVQPRDHERHGRHLRGEDGLA